ncbi:DUF4351 domain-containing protein [Gloeobacter violaceus]|uniref:DUF4351 domain-containing protein n=1 Tax=Gloeobacter violaceus TaxID=33072 RepID=UPI0038B2E868
MLYFKHFRRRQIGRKFGSVSDDLSCRIATVTEIDKLEQLAGAIIDAENIEGFTAYLDCNA